MATKRKKERLKRNGILYVSKNEFARQMGVSWQAINYMTKSGKIAMASIDGANYIDVEKWGPWYKDHLKKSKSNGRQRTRREAERGGYESIPRQNSKDISTTPPDIDFIGDAPKIRKEKVGKEKAREIDEVVLEQMRDSSELSFNSNTFSDCWIWDDETDSWALNKTTGEHLIDMDVATKKMKLMIYRQQYLKEAEKLVLKEDVDYTLREIVTPLVNTLSTIPDKFVVRVASYVERLGGIKIDGQKISSLKEELRDEVTSVIHTLEMAVRSTLGEEEEG